MPFILLVAWIVLESLLIGHIADRIGGLPVFMLLIVIAILGTQLMRRQGFKALAAVQSSMQRQELPTLTLLDSLIVFIAGMLLILPGFLSDGLALMMLFGGLRKRLAAVAEQHIRKRYPEYNNPVVIEGEFQTVYEQRDPLPNETRDD